MGCELRTEAGLDTDVVELSSTAQLGDDVSHPQPAGRDYLDTRSFDTRGTNVRLGPAHVCLPSRRRSSSIFTGAGISNAAPLLPALSCELERARGAGVDSGRNDKGSTPSLPGRRTDGTQVGGTIPIDVRIGDGMADESGSSAWWDRFDAMLGAMREGRRRSATVDADEDVDPAALELQALLDLLLPLSLQALK
ncbi:hypothetical protein DFH08DRAFT_964312 [Mycena albidolilacea]|uniref:Uncharacterized protein n=1 Tax=Mycena albidolilacea TaxID=1033008 RepID=A0AAD6ZUC2_9AGAR|nr:hypothetical protein DFH08DRAFT_964312 [Mycena albidolilacea]